jgi:threonine synthase
MSNKLCVWSADFWVPRLLEKGSARVITAQIQAYGAHAIISEWNGRGKLLEYLVRHGGWFPVSSLMPNPVNNPFGAAGYKTLAYEITSQLGRMPDRMLHPCVAGNSLFAAWKGFNELQKMGMKGSLPQMIACQPAGANSLEQSFRQNLQQVVWLDNPHSIAISTREPTSSPQCLWALYESHGDVVSVSDEEILEAMCWFGREGICAESASSTPVASLAKLVDQGKVQKDDTI